MYFDKTYHSYSQPPDTGESFKVMGSNVKVIYTISKSALFGRGHTDRQLAIEQHLIEFVITSTA